MTNDSDSSLRVKFATAAGLVTGTLKGKKAETKILSPFNLILKAGKIGSDTYVKNQSEYVRGCIENNMQTISNSFAKASERLKEYQKLSLDAAKTFENLAGGGIKKIIKQAKNTKHKYIALYGAIGIAVDLILNFVIKKISKISNIQKG